MRTDLMVPLLQSLLRQPIPTLRPVHSPRHLHRDFQIPTLDRQIEPRILILHKMERNLRESLLLEVGDDALAEQVRRPDEVQDLVVVVPDERVLEAVFGRVDGDGAGAGGAVEAVHGFAFDAGEVDGVVEGADYAVVAVQVMIRQRALAIQKGKKRGGGDGKRTRWAGST